MDFLKQFLDLQLTEYDHLHGRIKLTKIITAINGDDKLNNLITQFSLKGEIISPRVFNAMLHEKLFFILGNSQRLGAGICYCYLLHLTYLKQINYRMEN